jgi:ABC-type uncharacterized transport system permease subunit
MEAVHEMSTAKTTAIVERIVAKAVTVIGIVVRSVTVIVMIVMKMVMLGVGFRDCNTQRQNC